MKKLLALMLALLCFVLVGCGEEEPEEAPESTPTVLSRGDGFEVLMEYNEKDASTKYIYTITAEDGTVIESAACSNQPKVAKLGDGSLIGVRFTTDSRLFIRYYDLKNGLASPSYFRAFWDNGKLVAYNDFENSGKLVVCDMFNPDGFRAEKLIESEAMQLLIMDTAVNDDNTELKVTYKMGESGYEQSVTLPLVNAEA